MDEKSKSAEIKIDGYTKIDQYDLEKIERIAAHYKAILAELGEDPSREGLIQTPVRVAKALQYLTHGYDANPEEILRSAMFKEEYNKMVVVKDM